MGTWSTKINGNDTFLDIYQSFFDQYNEGGNPVNISKQIRNDFAEMFDDHEDQYNSLFGLALAQWETKSLSSEIFSQVKQIIESGKDLELWKELGADEKTLKQRKIVLDKFLNQISTERDKPKRRVKPKFEFETIALVNIIAPDLQKTFTVSEEYANDKYIHTSAIMKWSTGGGSVFYFKGQGKMVSAQWQGSQKLVIAYDKAVDIIKKDNTSYYCGDEVAITYVEI